MTGPSRIRSDPVGKGSVRVGPLMAIPQLLAQLGVDPEEVFLACAIAPSHFEDSENTISLPKVSRLLQVAVERTGCEHFGLLIAQHAPPQSMGAVGYLMLSSPNAGIALEKLIAHLNVQDRGAVVALRIEGKTAILSYSLLIAGLEQADQIYAASIGIGRNLMRGFWGPHWRPDAVTFSFARPRHVDAYRQYFGVTPRFDAPMSALLFPAALLNRQLPGSDPFLHRLMAKHIAEASPAAARDLVDDVRELLRIGNSVSDYSLPAIASRLGMAERTVKRQLAVNGTSFRAIRDDVRYDVSREFLEGTQMPISDIASVLGYASTAAFTRAFERWSGISPLKWRAGRPSLRGPSR
jgi:AraC-like DNA-binding protein